MVRRPTKTVALLALAGCVPNLAVEPGAEILCDTTDDCPAGFTCSEALGLCVTGDDQTPPEVDSFMVTPPRASDATPVTVTLVFSEDLPEPPTVRLGTPSRTPLDLTSGAGRDYTFGVTISDTEPSGAWPILVDAVDATGNAARDVSAGTILLDFDPPAILSSVMELSPDGSSALPNISAIRNGSGVLVRFSTSEDIRGTPTVALQCTGGTIPLARAANETDTALFTYTVIISMTHTASDGPCSVVATLEDLALNVTNGAVGTLTVDLDRTAPTAGAIDADMLQHIRAPWGEAFGSLSRGHFLSANDPSLDHNPMDDIPALAFGEMGEVLVEVRVLPADESVILGVSRRTMSGWSAVALAGLDEPSIVLRAIDRAGSSSPAVPITNGLWVATMGGKVAGSFLQNPHRLTEYRHAAPELGPASELPARLFPSVIDEYSYASDITVPTVGAAAWEPITIENNVVGRLGTHLAYHAANQQLVLFGGIETISMAPPSGPTLVSTEPGWQAVLVAEPPARYHGAMAYDPVRERTVLFGGRAAPTRDYLGDTWEWNGLFWEHRATTGPDPRARHSLAADGRGGMILFGGEDAIGKFGDSWRWDGVQWVELTVGMGPSPRSGHAMVHEPGTDRVFLYGGEDDGVCAGTPTCVELWQLSGATPAWSLVHAGANPGVDSPQWFFDFAYRRSGLAFDPMTGYLTTFVFGPSELVTWQWDGAAWNDLCLADPASCSPGLPRDDFAVAADPRNRSIVIAGGCDRVGGCVLDQAARDTHRFRDGRWSVGFFLEPPPDLQRAAITFDPTTDTMILAGGDIGPMALPERFTYRWDGWAWRTAGLLPTPRTLTSLAYDATADELVLFGGLDSAPLADTLVNDTGTSWTDPSPSAEPSARHSPSSAFDPGRGEVLLFGGSSVPPHTHAWNPMGGLWNTVTMAGPTPAPLVDFPMATDWAANRVMLFYSLVFAPETWVFQANAWSEVTDDNAPDNPESAGLAYSSALDTVVLAVRRSNELTVETHRYGTSGWLPLDAVTPYSSTLPPAGDLKHAFARAPDDRLMLVHTGAEWYLHPTGVGGRHFRVEVGSAALDATVAITESTIRWAAEGTGGAALHGWDGYRWVVLATHTTDGGTPARLEADSTALGPTHGVFGPDDTVRMMVTSRQPSGNTPAHLTTDWPKLFVRYAAAP